MTTSSTAPAGGFGFARACQNLCESLCIWAERFAMLMLMAMTALIVLQVLGRNLLGAGWPWAEELARYAGLALVYMGAPVLLLSWVPLIGDALCVAAGWLRLYWLPCALFMALGKFARYWLVAHGASL